MDRSKKNDNTDPTVEGASSGMKDREESEGVARSDKPQAATEREGLKHWKKAKKEHPKAPEPIIGMNDERAQVRFHSFRPVTNKLGHPWNKESIHSIRTR